MKLATSIKKLFVSKSEGQTDNEKITLPAELGGETIEKWSPRWIELNVLPSLCGEDFIELFESVPEVFFPINFIASRIAGATFEVKRVKDDSIVYYKKELNKFLDQPNCLMKFRELVYLHFVYKLATGNAFLRAAGGEGINTDRRWRWCDNFWELPADFMEIVPNRDMSQLFGIAKKEDLIKAYRLQLGMYAYRDINPDEIWHDRDGGPSFYGDSRFMKSKSRLLSQKKAVSNLLAVYQARNLIYVKQGGLGFIISKKQDPTGTIALTEKEKKAIIEQHNGKYGITGDRLPYGISDVPIDFVRTNLSISELQPFDETLQDAITIAGAYGIPSVLVPRKDQSTFSNQSTAEKAVYSSQIIPMTKRFCQDLTSFLGLEEDGLYLDCCFRDVDCLQDGLKDAEEVKKMLNERCKMQFLCGVITINDWRAQICEEKLEGEVFDKVMFNMTDEEIAFINRVFNIKSEIEDERRNQAPSVQDEGK
ncbi:MAG: phage portal protein [Bacteroidaceae bacterium]|nr:phage portal protein [Bacteroidaceae bacterium]